MPTSSPVLGLNIFSGSDTFNLAQYDANWTTLDDSPGIFLCTSTTRPSWGAAQNGCKIAETDTGLTWTWSGSAFSRSPKGFLGRTKTLSNVGTTSQWSPAGGGTYVTAVSIAVTVPPGGHQVEVSAEVPEVQNPTGITYLILSRPGVVLNSWPVWTLQEFGSGASGNPGTSASFKTYDVPNSTSASISITYTLSFAASPTFTSGSNTYGGGTSTLIASTNRPLAITAVEV